MTHFARSQLPPQAAQTAVGVLIIVLNTALLLFYAWTMAAHSWPSVTAWLAARRDRAPPNTARHKVLAYATRALRLDGNEGRGA